MKPSYFRLRVMFASVLILLVCADGIAAEPDFAPPIAYRGCEAPLMSHPMGRVGILDFNEDGVQDILFEQCALLGKSGGGYGSPLSIPGKAVLAAAGPIGVGDRPELVFCEANPQNDGGLESCTAHQSDGAQNLKPSSTDLSGLYGVKNWKPAWLQVADLNGDDRSDLFVVLMQKDKQILFKTYFRVGILPRLSSGKFGPLIVFPDLGTGNPGVGREPFEIADLGGDPLPEIALAVSDIDPITFANRNYIAVMENRGDFKFKISEVLAPATVTPHSIKSGDVDGDGRPDLLISDDGGINDFPGYFAEYLNKGALQFESTGKLYNSGVNHPETVDLSDLDGDGKADILSPGGTDFEAIYLHLSESPPQDARWKSVSVRRNTQAYFVDVNGDGKQDILSDALDGVGLDFSITLQE